MMNKNAFFLSLSLCFTLGATDWSQWGGGESRNMVSDEKGMPEHFEPGVKYGPRAATSKIAAGLGRPDAQQANQQSEAKFGPEDIDLSTTKECKWIAKLGSQSYGTPTIAGNKVFVGTNNESPRSKRHVGDRGVVMCFEEKTGSFLWQMICPKMGSGKVNDWEYLGICAAPTVVGNRAYVPSNRCQIVCLDVEGQKNGNDGMTDESNFTATLDKDGKMVKNEPDEQEADIIWVYDMYKELGVFQHNATSGYPLIFDGKLFTTTCNGVDWTHTNIPSPQSPSFIMLDANQGHLLGEMDHVASERVLHCSWSSPTQAIIAGKPAIIFAAGDGWVYGMRAETQKDGEGFDILKEEWRFDANPKEYRQDESGEKRKYTDFDGPSEIIATPVEKDGLLYVAIGQDPEHGEGLGMLTCMSVEGSGDITGKALWTFKDIERSISTCAVKDGLLYTADYTGRVFCIDAKTGVEKWRYDTKGHIWASPLVVDGKVYIGNEEGELFIFAEGAELNLLRTVEFPSPLYSSVVAANGALYVTTHTHLYCFKK
jgi:outer membrane protein assembly factor BamB